MTVDGESSKGVQPGVVAGPMLYYRPRGSMEATTTKPDYLARLERAVTVQPPVRFGRFERLWRWVLGR